MLGLIDTHLHFSGNRTDDDSDWVLEPVMQKTIVAVAQAREALEHGLTSVGEISRSGIHIRNMIEEGVIPGPRVAATKNGAEMLKIDSITGAFEKGKFADLLVIKGNPLDDIHNIDVSKMEVIMKEGSFVKISSEIKSTSLLII